MLQTRHTRGRDDGDPADARRAYPEASAVLPVNHWNNGEFKDQLDPQTYRYTTLHEMFARDMAAPKAKEYVSSDGSLFCQRPAPSAKARRTAPAGVFPTPWTPMAS